MMVRTAGVVVAIGAALARGAPGQTPELHPAFTPLGDAIPATLALPLVESRDGRYLIANTDSAEQKDVRRFDRATGRWTPFPVLRADHAYGPSSPDGRFLASLHREPGDTAWYVWVTPVNPATLAPVADPRRVSRSRATSIAFAPDSRTVAFTSPDSAVNRVIAVPVNGGEERVVWQHRAPGELVLLGVWSGDGRYLYVDHVIAGKPDILRIALPGGVVDTISGRRGVVGFTRDGRFLAQSPPGTLPWAAVADPEGHEYSQLLLPRGVTLSGWSNRDSAHLLGVEQHAPKRLHIVSLEDAAWRDLSGGHDDRNPGWSPDGRLLAFERRMDASYHVVIADGRGRVRQVMRAPSDAVGPLQWSPDGRLIAYAGYAPSQLHLVTPATGEDRAITPPDRTRWPGNFVWLNDSRTLRYLTPRFGASEVRDVTVDGRIALVRTLPGVYGGGNQWALRFVGPHQVVVANEDSMVVIPLPRGTARVLYRGPVGLVLGSSVDGHWLAVATSEAAPESDTLRLMNVVSGEVRTLSYRLAGGFSRVLFHPDGRHLVVSGWAQRAVREEITLVSLEGEPPRPLSAADRDAVDFGSGGVSPDGRLLVYQANQAWVSQLVEADLTPALAHLGAPCRWRTWACEPPVGGSPTRVGDGARVR